MGLGEREQRTSDSRDKSRLSFRVSRQPGMLSVRNFSLKDKGLRTAGADKGPTITTYELHGKEEVDSRVIIGIWPLKHY